jgi:DNA invertase Pin-like site-specific DNA recombinase
MRVFIPYYRVSTERQGRSGLGLEAQRAAVAAYIESQGGEVLESFTEVESGKRDDRPQLKAAFEMAEVTGGTVVFAKLDRLSRNAAFLLNLRDSSAKFVALDCPELDTLSLGMRAVIAQHERETISTRTKSALQAAKKRLDKEGRRLGNPNGLSEAAARRGRNEGAKSKKATADAFAMKLAPVLANIKSQGASGLSALAVAMNAKRIVTSSGGAWNAKAVSRILARLPA